MEFGKVEDPAEVDITLPEDHSETKQVLSAWKAERGNSEPRIYVRCAKWGRSEWLGRVYPKGTKAGDYLSFYSQQFIASN